MTKPLPKNDSRKALLEDISSGGVYGYAYARGFGDWNYPSTIEFEESVLRDILIRATSISYAEADDEYRALVEKHQKGAREAFQLADWVWHNIPLESLPVEYGIRMNTVFGMLLDLGIEVEDR